MEIVREEDWVNGGEYKWAAYVEMTAKQIADLNNLVVETWDGNGLGMIEGLMLRDDTGRQLIVSQLIDNPDPVWAKRCEISFVRDGMTLYEIEQLAVRMMSELEISIDKLVMFYDGLDEARARLMYGDPVRDPAPAP